MTPRTRGLVALGLYTAAALALLAAVLTALGVVPALLAALAVGLALAADVLTPSDTTDRSTRR